MGTEPSRTPEAGQAALTDAEHELCLKLGTCAEDYITILLDGTPDDGRNRWNRLSEAQRGDTHEFIGHVHDLQHAVMARAAIRAHPDRYRP